MAVANDNLEPDLRLDPELARIYVAASAEEDAADGPPPALDAVILAAARREVGAGPAVLGAAPRTRPLSKRWFVPVSIAAVLTLSVSLVSLVRVEKGDDLAQAPASAPVASRPAPAGAPPAATQERDAKVDDAVAMKDGAPMPEPAKPATALDMPKVAAKQQAPDLIEAKRKEASRSTDADLAKTRVASATAATAEKRVAQAFPNADAEASAPVAGVSAGATANAPAREAEVARDAVAVRVPPLPPSAPSIPAPAPVVAESSRRADNAANSTFGIRGHDGAGTVTAPPPPAVAAAKPAPTQSVAKAAEGYADGRVMDNTRRREERPAVSAAPAAPADRQLLRSTGGQPGTGSTQGTPGTQGPRPSWLASLDNQPAGKWLEKLAELRREGRIADAEQLLAEFRRRFPDHPASR